MGLEQWAQRPWWPNWVAQVDNEHGLVGVAGAGMVCIIWPNPQGACAGHPYGTNTLEETSLVLPVFCRRKPIVLTCAMRPATAQCPMGRKTCAISVTLAATLSAGGDGGGCRGYSAVAVQKCILYRLDAFDSATTGR